jgi:Tol biopolymer transport system component
LKLEAGAALEHYRLVEKIGEGGMGVVWKARDTTLDREVAIKVLPLHFSGDADRLARFEREAKLLAALNHPNIASIYGLHRTGDLNFLALELVPGEDLAERLSRGALPQEEALRVALQVAQALETAHENGVIHRDLKPGNVKLTPDGTVKVLDFGLAKAFSPGAASESIQPTHSPTITSAGTVAGLILGTAAYMSPEQAKGKAIDRRADVWSFGTLLYEMLTGERLFGGETVSETIAAVIMKDLRWDGLPGTTPPRVRRLLRRCLQRDARSRLRDIGDARLVIEETLAGADRDEAGQPAAATAARGKWLLAGAALVAGVVLGATLLPLVRPAAPAQPLRKFELPAQDVEAVRISPDGRRVAYVTSTKLFVRDLDRPDVRPLPAVASAGKPFWAPDGEWLGFGGGGKLWKIAATGGQPAVLCELPGSGWGGAAGGAWRPDGTIVFTTGDTGLLQVTSQGGDPRPLLEQDPEKEDDFHDVAPLPDGRGVLYVVHRKGDDTAPDTLAAYVDGKARYLLKMEGQRLSNPAYSPTGHVLFHREPGNPGIWALPVSTETFGPAGEPFLVAQGADFPSVADDGTLVFLSGAGVSELQLAVFDRNGSEMRTIGDPGQSWVFPAVSPDERRLAVAVLEGTEWDLWVHDIARGTRTRLTFEGDANESAWSPDGTRLVYYRGENPADFRMWLLNADGTGQAEDLGPGWFPAFTPDGNSVVHGVMVDGTNADLRLLPLAGEEREPVPLLANANAQEIWGRVSPDGRYLAYQAHESGKDQVYIKKFPGGEGKWQVSVIGGNWPVWSGDGGRLFFAQGPDIFEVDVSTAGPLELGAPRKLFTRRPTNVDIPWGWPDGFDVSADGERFYLARPLGDEPLVQNLAVVLNWSAEFR